MLLFQNIETILYFYKKIGFNEQETASLKYTLAKPRLLSELSACGICKVITGEKKVPQLALGRIKPGQNKHKALQYWPRVTPFPAWLNAQPLLPRAAALSPSFESFRAHLWLCNLLWVIFPPPCPNADVLNRAASGWLWRLGAYLALKYGRLDLP